MHKLPILIRAKYIYTIYIKGSMFFGISNIEVPIQKLTNDSNIFVLY